MLRIISGFRQHLDQKCLLKNAGLGTKIANTAKIQSFSLRLEKMDVVTETNNSTFQNNFRLFLNVSSPSPIYHWHYFIIQIHTDT